MPLRLLYSISGSPRAGLLQCRLSLAEDIELLPPQLYGLLARASRGGLLAGQYGQGHRVSCPFVRTLSQGSRDLVNLWVPETLHMSCDVLIFVEEAAEAVVSLDLADLGRRAVGEWP